MVRFAIVSAVAESSTEVRLLRQHGFTVRVAASAAADVVLPSAGGSLAFCILSGDAPAQPVAGRAAQAAKAARRCTILWVRADGNAADEVSLQNACPAGVSVLRFESHEQACEQYAADQRGTASHVAL
jgi:hypothetical protein